MAFVTIQGLREICCFGDRGQQNKKVLFGNIVGVFQ